MKEHSAILLTCIKRLLVLKSYFFFIFESGHFTQVLRLWICTTSRSSWSDYINLQNMQTTSCLSILMHRGSYMSPSLVADIQDLT